MTLDLGIQLDPNGDAGVKLTVVDASGKKTLQRPKPALSQEQLDALRGGESLEATAQPLADEISDWFLGKELAKRLGKSLGGQDSVRLVFRMNRDLPAELGDLPVELVTLPNMPIPLILHPRVGSIVRIPPLIQMEAATEARDWPFRVLLVRSNPEDLGGSVPEAMPIVEQIRQAAKDRGLPDGAVQVELVSSETNGADLVSWARFREALGSGPFDVCVYLGHGDLQAVPPGPPVGYLQFEAAHGKEAIDARRIAAELAQHPVRVVVLAGCLTAAAADAADAEAVERREELGRKLPEYLRGAQGVAQAIVGEAPVELAVGMRDLLEVNTATLLIGSFFQNLIKDHPGDVERAIREARSDLFGAGRFPPSWSSAIVFSKGSAPFFEFMREDPAQSAFLADRQKDFELVRVFRQNAQKLFLEAVGDRSPFLAALAVASEMDKAAAKGDAMVRPKLVQAATGKVEIPVELVRSLDAKRVTGKVTISGDDSTIDRLVVDPRLKAADFMFLHSEDGSKANFSIDADSAGSLPLAEGPLFTIEATITSPAPAVHEVVVTRARCEPETTVWSGMDVIAVVS